MEGGTQEAQISNKCSNKEANESLNALLTAIQPGALIPSFLLQVKVNSVDTNCLIDTGAAISRISHGLWRKLQSKDTQLNLGNTGHELVGFQGAPLKLLRRLLH